MQRMNSVEKLSDGFYSSDPSSTDGNLENMAIKSLSHSTNKNVDDETFNAED